MKNFNLKILIFYSFFFLYGFYSFGQFVTLNGRQFKDENGHPFYPVMCNYLISMPYIRPDTNSPPSDFLLGPASAYGSTWGDDYCHFNDATMQILHDFQEIKQMGFNSIRLMPILEIDPEESPTFCSVQAEYPNQDKDSKKKQWKFIFRHPYSSDENLQKLLDQYEEVFRQAAQAGLYILLVPANGGLFNSQQTVNNYIDLLREFGKHLSSKSNLLGYDLINEPFNTASSNYSKGFLCTWTTQIYDAMKYNQPPIDPNHLITVGGISFGDALGWDPAVLKIDFWAPHIYPEDNRRRPFIFNDKLEDVQNVTVWVMNHCPMPWMISETGFIADDSVPTPYPIPSPTPPPPPLVWGTQDQQGQYADQTLTLFRNADASGTAWWQFQNVHWYSQPPLSGRNYASDDYYYDATNYLQNNFGLLRFDDIKECSNQTGVYEGLVDYSPFEKPQVVNVFKQYLNGNNQPPSVGQPPIKTNSYANFERLNSNHLNKIHGRVIDSNNHPIEGAVVLGMALCGQTNVAPDPNKPLEIVTQEVPNNQYTFTDADGFFTLIPFDYMRPISNPSPVNQKEYFEKLWISAFGYEQYYVNICPNDSHAYTNCHVCDFANGDTVGVYKLKNNDFLNNNILGSIVQIGQMQLFTGLKTLTLTNTLIDGDGNNGGTSDITAREEIHLLSSFDAKQGCSVHIFPSVVFADCDSYQSSSLESPIIEPSSSNIKSKNIELHFSKALWDFKIFPNPTSGHLNLVFNMEEESNLINHVEVLSTVGSLLETYTCSKFLTLDLNYLPKGVYYVKAYNEKHRYNSQKLILY